MGLPPAVVAVSLILFVPAARFTVNVWLAQVSHVPVPPNERPAETTVPFTLTSAGRLVVVPLA